MGDPDHEYVTHERCNATSAIILQKLDSIEKRLFRDNGSVSIQTRIDRHEQVVRVILWIVGIIGGTFLVACGSGLVFVVRELLMRGAL